MGKADRRARKKQNRALRPAYDPWYGIPDATMVDERYNLPLEPGIGRRLRDRGSTGARAGRGKPGHPTRD